jgi:hypothetical protein
VKVPGLVNLPVSQDYVKLGGTGNHPGPDDNCFNGTTSDYDYVPDYNHWATPATVTELIAVNSRWSAEYEEDELWINDMSLPTGGRFDVFGNWYGDHSFHRLGRDVDVRTTRSASIVGVPVETLGSYVENNQTKLIVKNRDFDTLTKQITGLEAQVHDKGGSNEHYHIYFYR